MILEIACNNFASCLNAEKGGADRIELFESLADGGCTPSYGMIKKVKAEIKIPIYVMIRPRGGDFVYSKDEIEIMKSDIDTCLELNVDGIVFGVLNEEGNVDLEINKDLLNHWKNRPATFHRAFDRSINLEKSCAEIIDLGFERILTSGGMKTVEEGKEIIKSLQKNFGDKIIIMPGSGVSPQNAKNLSDFCNTNEIHATCKTSYNNPDLTYNKVFSDSYTLSDLKEIEALRKAIN